MPPTVTALFLDASGKRTAQWKAIVKTDAPGGAGHVFEYYAIVVDEHDRDAAEAGVKALCERLGAVDGRTQ